MAANVAEAQPTFLSPAPEPQLHTTLFFALTAYLEPGFSHCALLFGSRGDRCLEKLRDLPRVMAKKWQNHDLEPDLWL